jgi:serine/threonine-protein kinase HipA
MSSNSRNKTYGKVLAVKLGNTPVGTLTLLNSEQTLFAFEDSYINDSERPTLSLSFKTASGGLRTKARPTQTRVPPFFSNLLPEGPLRHLLAERAGVHPDREFFLLSALKDDLPGAVVLSVLEIGEVSEGPRAAAVNDLKKNALRFSLAGVQLKFSAIMSATGGLTVPVDGVNGKWIVKLPSMRFSSVPENEFSMMQYAKKIGMNIPEVRLIPTNSIEGLPEGLPENFGTSLAIKRFDRDDIGNRTHIEDFSQVYGLFPEQKYKEVSYRDIASLLWIESGPDAIVEFIRRLVFNLGIGNADMHSKNWSLIYPNKRTPELSPGYDFVSTVAYLPDNNLGLSLVGKKNMYEITTEDFRRLATKAGLPEKLVMDTVSDTITRMHDSWKVIKKDFPLPSPIAKKIEGHMKNVPVMAFQ